MSLRDQLLQASQDDNVKKMLHVISILEGSSGFSNPYLASGGSLKGELLTTGYDTHPTAKGVGKWTFKGNDGSQISSTANGRYMTRLPTWNDAVKALGGNVKFDPQGQDLVATYLIHRRGALDDVKRGDFKTAIQKLGKEWASLPTAPDSYNQFKHGWQKVQQAFKTAGLDPSLVGGSATVTPQQNAAIPTPMMVAGEVPKDTTQVVDKTLEMIFSAPKEIQWYDPTANVKPNHGTGNIMNDTNYLAKLYQGGKR